MSSSVMPVTAPDVLGNTRRLVLLGGVARVVLVFTGVVVEAPVLRWVFAAVCCVAGGRCVALVVVGVVRCVLVVVVGRWVLALVGVAAV